MHPPGYQAPPARLVEDGAQRFGRFDAAVGCANLIDANYLGLPWALKWMRLKEWQAVQLSTPRLFVNVALFDAKLMGLRQIKIYDKKLGKKTLHERKLPPRALHIADQLHHSSNTHGDRHGMLRFENLLDGRRIDVELDIPATPDRGRITGRVRLHTSAGASQVVSLPFGGKTGMYSHKGMFPAEGEIVLDGETHRFDARNAVGLLDDHKGYYPYVMRWDWVTGAAHDAQGVARGVNLTWNQARDPDRYNENCAWIGDRIGCLPAVRFVRENARLPGERWRIQDREGRVDVTFEPTVPGDVKVNALVVESRYRGPFGKIRGRVEPQGLDPIEIDDWFGMGEEFWLRC